MRTTKKTNLYSSVKRKGTIIGQVSQSILRVGRNNENDNKYERVKKKANKLIGIFAK